MTTSRDRGSLTSRIASGGDGNGGTPRSPPSRIPLDRPRASHGTSILRRPSYRRRRVQNISSRSAAQSGQKKTPMFSTIAEQRASAPGETFSTARLASRGRICGRRDEPRNRIATESGVSAPSHVPGQKSTIEQILRAPRVSLRNWRPRPFTHRTRAQITGAFLTRKRTRFRDEITPYFLIGIKMLMSSARALSSRRRT